MSTVNLANDSVLNQQSSNRFLKLDQSGQTVVTYVIIDSWYNYPQVVRSKSRILKGPVKSIDDVPEWSHPRPSNVHNVHDSVYEDIIKPVAMFRDPFLGDPNKLVLCEVYQADGKPVSKYST